MAEDGSVDRDGGPGGTSPHRHHRHHHRHLPSPTRGDTSLDLPDHLRNLTTPIASSSSTSSMTRYVPGSTMTKDGLSSVASSSEDVGPVQGDPAAESSPYAGALARANREVVGVPPETRTAAPVQTRTPEEAEGTPDFIAFRSKVVSRLHAEIWIDADGQPKIRDLGSSSGTFLNRLRLSPSGRESRPYPLKSGDIVQLGVDYQGRQEDIFRGVQMRIFISPINTVKKADPQRLKTALRTLISAMSPTPTDPADPSGSDCCICLSSLSPSQSLFLAPCSHCFHYKCVMPLLGPLMFQCPLCRQVANLDASVIDDADSVGASPDNTSPTMRRTTEGEEVAPPPPPPPPLRSPTVVPTGRPRPADPALALATPLASPTQLPPTMSVPHRLPSAEAAAAAAAGLPSPLSPGAAGDAEALARKVAELDRAVRGYREVLVRMMEENPGAFSEERREEILRGVVGGRM
ncbi:hypothetical protein HDU96_009639 [Phlyctochytrium bullatum]|nr:hypothetical protein HDU96_009639 [Phlyctochytrium bullatum]